MAEKGVTEEVLKHEAVINHELRLVFDTFGIGEYGKTEDELKELRYFAGDLEEIEGIVTGSILNNTELKEGDTDFDDLVKVVIYSYYLMLHFTDMYLESGDFSGLTDSTFGYVWGSIPVEDKATVIEMAVVLEDTLTIVHGMYVLLAQSERKL